ncbi:MAG TPA: polymer-forming cytoskeletal protein [Acidimicrobiia bacterium]
MSYERFGTFAILGLLIASALPDGGSLHAVRRMSDVVVIGEQERLADDLIVVAQDLRIEGTVEGDVIAFTDLLTVSGTVAGDLLGFSRRADIGGEVQGSVRLAGGILEVGGRVGEDVTSAVLRLAISGRVGRDVYAVGADLEIDGSVGRDVSGRLTRRVLLAGSVGRDLEPVTPRLIVTEGASVGGTVVVWAGTEAAIAEEAEVGTVVNRSPAGAQIQVRAARLMVLVVAAIAFSLVGIAAFWLLPSSLREAMTRLRRRPLSTLLLGVAFVAVPVALLAMTVAVAAFAPVIVAAPALAVLVPLTLAVAVLSLVLAVVAPVPVLATAGRLVLPRFSPAGAFVLAAAAWMLVLAVPWVGSWVATLVAVWGLGAWASGAWLARGDPAWAFEAGEPS